MDYIQQRFSVPFEYRVYFTSDLFNLQNAVLQQFLQTDASHNIKKIFFVIDSGVAEYHPKLTSDIQHYFSVNKQVTLIENMLIVPGGEACKNTDTYVNDIVEAVDKYGIDRHSYIAAIGGGAVLDMVGYAAAISHRGIRHIRIPTTVLSQNDSGVGVKNSINYKGKKNFIGTFAPPVAVFNDEHFLFTLSEREWRAGIAEAVKVALIKDKPFYSWLCKNALALSRREMEPMQYQIKRCAQLHIDHIAGGDPFEKGSSRPLDFGHWSAHKVEQLSGFEIRHGEAVAMGIALDTVYSHLCGWLNEADTKSVLQLLIDLGFDITHPMMEISDDDSPLIKGLHEFQEHLGGMLTIMLLRAIGKGEEVHHLDIALLKKSSDWLKQYHQIAQQ
ncbi:MAG: 3-dehydroquinate synthase [Chitinophagaceae bacterium]|nr:3-dehydroquinate synthase [Chitinophagaceae bacterium]